MLQNDPLVDNRTYALFKQNPKYVKNYFAFEIYFIANT